MMYKSEKMSQLSITEYEFVESKNSKVKVILDNVPKLNISLHDENKEKIPAWIEEEN